MPSILPGALNPVHQIRVMGRFVRRRVKKPGTAPGTLVHTGPRRIEQVRLSVMEYDEQDFRERELTDLDAEWPVGTPPGLDWLNMDGLHEVELIRNVGERLGIHGLVLEDIVSLGQRAKAEEHQGYLFIVMPMLALAGPEEMVQEEQVSMVLGPQWLLTFQERAGDAFDPVRERIRTSGTRMRTSGADYLAYALVDAVVDRYFSILEQIGQATEQVELEVMADPDPATMHRLHALKREIMILRRAVWPVRDMVNALLRTDSPLVAQTTKVYLKDVYDHVVQVIDTVESLRDVVNGLVDLYLSQVSYRTNEVMKVLTIMASIFIPLTFLAGVYGMNFAHMPELAMPWAYPAVLGVMAAVALTMMVYFKRKRWF